MKQTRFVILTIVLLTVFRPLSLWAEPVSETRALQEARAFLMERGRGHLLRPTARAAKVRSFAGESGDVDPYYVFNLRADSGFVVVSGEDKVVSILAYSYGGAIEKDNMPDALRDLLDSYAEQIAWIRENGEAVDEESAAYAPARTSVARSPIAPLIQTRWNQKQPYNKYCPTIPDGTLQGDTCVTGCVATALAQVIKYHQWPTGATTAIPGYTSRNNKFTLDELPAITFDWANMTNTYSNASTDAAKNAVAELMQYCGWAVQMNYYGKVNTNVSGAFNQNIPYALKTYFDYDPELRYTQRRNYTYLEWISLLYNELASSRPVIMGAQSAGGGHAFVCDGYENDDYFHMNWGWGGSGDGYFRLSLLNPYEQGAGGSSTQDGFGYDQDAVIGIKPRTGGTSGEHYCMLAQTLCFGSSDVNTVKVFNRASTEEAFSDISLYVGVTSMMLGSNTFDYALQLTDANNTQLLTGTTSSLGIEATYFASATVSIPASVPNGTYNIKILSRLKDGETWLETYDNDRYQMTAVISGTTLTITAPFAASANPTFGSMTVKGPHLVGYEDTVQVTLTGVTEYHDNLFLYLNSAKVMGKQADIPAGETVTVQFVFTPKTIGTNTLAVYAKNAKLSETTVTIGGSNASDTLVLSASANVLNLVGTQLSGNAFKAKITMTNASVTHSYVGRITCSVRKWTSSVVDNETVWEWVSLGTVSKQLIVPKKVDETDGSTDVLFDIFSIQPQAGATYSFRFTYRKSDADGNVADAVHVGYNGTNGTLTFGGYVLGNAAGERTYEASSSTVDCGSACYVDLRAIADLGAATITASTNPNCLYLLATGAETPSALREKNVVKGGAAGTITLVDGSDFYSPTAFTASNISYTRTFTLAAAAGGKGWNTLCLPFTVENVTCDGMGEVDWFHSSSDAGKNFWLRAFSADESGRIYFDYADALEANTPYLIAVPGDTWGSAYQMTGKAVTFSATDVRVGKTSEGAASGNYFKFCGATVNKSLSDVYELNAEGGKFEYKATTTASPFRAWVTPVHFSSLLLPYIGIGSGTPTGLEECSPEMEEGSRAWDESWYTLTGLRLEEKPRVAGAYVHKGQVVIIK